MCNRFIRTVSSTLKEMLNTIGVKNNVQSVQKRLGLSEIYIADTPEDKSIKNCFVFCTDIQYINKYYQT